MRIPLESRENEHYAKYPLDKNFAALTLDGFSGFFSATSLSPVSLFIRREILVVSKDGSVIFFLSSLSYSSVLTRASNPSSVAQ
jgi:hypothetical protein